MWKKVNGKINWDIKLYTYSLTVSEGIRDHYDVGFVWNIQSEGPGMYIA